ncbi:hypothetical protein GCM10010517_20640 [Streptosporangium fragile]|uniref:Polysaccharide biosynthesis protein n=1 Tax=Streptosporangium fragile TaxID=46186 RepID=A0ABN3VTW3_9ACTN
MAVLTRLPPQPLNRLLNRLRERLLTRLRDLARTAGAARSGVTRSGAAGLAGAGVAAMAQFSLVVVVTRGTAPETAGAFFAATALCLTAAAVLRLDAGNGLVHVIARTRPSGHRPAPGRHGSDRPMPAYHLSGYIRAALLPVAALSLTVGVVVTLTAADPALRVLAVALPFLACADVVVSATRGFGAMRPTVLLDGVFQPVARLVLVGGAVLAGVTSVPMLTAAWALPSLPVLLLAWLWLRRRPLRAPDGPHVPDAPRIPDEPNVPDAPGTPSTVGVARDLWRHTWPRSLAAGIQAVFQRMDIVIVAALAGPAEAAVYTAATRFKIVGQLAGQGLARAAQPRLVRAMAEGDLPRARALYRSSTRVLVLLTWPIWLAYAAVAPWLLGVVFGEDYASGAPVALVLAATMMLATACGMADVVLTSAGHTGSSLAHLAAAVATAVLLDVLLVPGLGALGAALGWAGGTAVKNLLPLWRIHRGYGLRPFGFPGHAAPATGGTR